MADGDGVGTPVGCGVWVGEAELVCGVVVRLAVGVLVGVVRETGFGVVVGGAVVGTGPVDVEG